MRTLNLIISATTLGRLIQAVPVTILPSFTGVSLTRVLETYNASAISPTLEDVKNMEFRRLKQFPTLKIRGGQDHVSSNLHKSLNAQYICLNTFLQSRYNVSPQLSVGETTRLLGPQRLGSRIQTMSRIPEHFGIGRISIPNISAKAIVLLAAVMQREWALCNATPPHTGATITSTADLINFKNARFQLKQPYSQRLTRSSLC